MRSAGLGLTRARSLPNEPGNPPSVSAARRLARLVARSKQAEGQPPNPPSPTPVPRAATSPIRQGGRQPAGPIPEHPHHVGLRPPPQPPAPRPRRARAAVLASRLASLAADPHPRAALRLPLARGPRVRPDGPIGWPHPPLPRPPLPLVLPPRPRRISPWSRPAGKVCVFRPRVRVNSGPRRRRGRTGLPPGRGVPAETRRALLAARGARAQLLHVRRGGGYPPVWAQDVLPRPLRLRTV
jgi:hypothetical protein